MGSRPPSARRHRLGLGRARPRSAHPVRRQGPLGRGVGGSGLGVGAGSPRGRVALPRAGYVCAECGRGGRTRRNPRSANARHARRGRAGSSRRPSRERRERPPTRGHAVAGRPHSDRGRAGRGAARRDGRGRRSPQASPRPAVQARGRRATHRSSSDVVGLQCREQDGDDEVRSAVVAAHADAARARVRHARGGRACRCCSRWPACSARAGCSSSPDSSSMCRSGR